MRKVGQDRAAWTSSPPEPNTARELERLRDQDTNIETIGGGGGTYEVSGLAPVFTGDISGIPSFYVAAVVQNSTINMSNTVLLEDGISNLPFVQDTANAFGIGTASVVGKLDALSGAAIYNFASGSASSLNSTDAPGGFRIGTDFAIATIQTPTQLPTLALIQSGVASTVTLSAPSGHSWLQGVGAASNGTDICAVWTNTNSTGSGTAVVARHNLSGVIQGSPSSVAVVRTGAVSCLVDNGIVAFVVPTATYYAPASGSATLVLSANIGVSSRSNMTNNISSDGYIFMNITNDLYRLNLASGLTSVWPEVFARYSGDPAVLVATLSLRSMHAISATKLVYGSVRVLVAGSVNAPMYSAVVLDGSGANVSDSVFTQYSGTNTSSYQGVYALTRQSNGNVVFALASSEGSDITGTRYLIQVSGP